MRKAVFRSPAGPGRPRFLLRDAADIRRAFVHLLTHWRLPRIEVRVDRLPLVDSQRAQDRCARLAEACNCLLGEMLAAVTLLGGSFMVWTSMRGWRDLGPVLMVTLCAGLAGKGIELAWTRLRLLLVLRGLRRRLADVVAGRQARTPVTAAAGKPIRQALNIDHGDEAPNNRLRRPLVPDGPARPKVLLRDAADINHLALRVATRWTLPRVEIRVEELPKLAVQRAQDRFVRLSGGCNYLLAGVLATASLLGGLFYFIWTSSQDLMWTSGQGWHDVALVLAATLYAALIGCAIEVLWIRVRLLLVLRGLRRGLRMA